MKQFVYLAVAALLVGLVAFRLSGLGYSFFWDESWSYAPGVRLMYDSGPSLLPGSIDVHYSRGHPLLFYAIVAAWMKVAGTTHLAQHLLMLLIAAGNLLMIHKLTTAVFGKTTGLLSILFIAFQTIYMVQSTMLYPELLLSMLTFAAIYAFIYSRHLLLFATLSMLFLTKESGLLAGVVLLSYMPVEWARTRRIEWRKYLPVAGALCVVGAFFLYQKHMYGWYLFPEHVGLMKTGDWAYFEGMLRYITEILLTHGSRVYLSAGVVVMAAACISSTYRKFWILTIMLAGLVAIIVYNQLGVIDRRLLWPLIVGVTMYTLHTGARLLRLKDAQQKWVVICGIYIAASMIFYSTNFFTIRYLLPCIAIVSVATCALLYGGLRQMSIAGNRASGILALVILAANVVASTGKGAKVISDTTWGAFDAMDVQGNVVAFLEKKNVYDSTVSSNAFLQREHLTKPYTGFLSGTKKFTKVTDKPGTRYVVVDNIEPFAGYAQLASGGEYRRIYRTVKGVAWAEVYELNQK